MIRSESKMAAQLALMLIYVSVVLAILANAGIAWLSPW